MATKKNTKAKKPTEHIQPAKLNAVRSWLQRLFVVPAAKLKRRITMLLKRRPHRSFQRTRRRDYVRSLKLPGYWAFTNYVRKTLWQHKRLFLWLVVVYGILTLSLVGIASQGGYAELSYVLREASEEVAQGNWGEVGNAGLLLASGVSGAFSSTPTEAQRVYGAILILFVWLTTVWLLRAILAGQCPKLRDGLYNAGAPIIPTFLVGLMLLVQLLPVVLAIIGYGAAVSSGLLGGGIEAMLFWTVAGLLAMLSLYWLAGTAMALVVVTLPGMYPMQALRTAGDLVIGRRVRLLLRILWLALILVVIWLVIMVPVILLDMWLKDVFLTLEWLPVVPVALLVMSTLTVVWVASYVYLLYRKVVDDDAAPA